MQLHMTAESEPVHGERYDAVVQNPEYEHEETAGLNYLQKINMRNVKITADLQTGRYIWSLQESVPGRPLKSASQNLR